MRVPKRTGVTSGEQWLGDGEDVGEAGQQGPRRSVTTVALDERDSGVA